MIALRPLLGLLAGVGLAAAPAAAQLVGKQLANGVAGADLTAIDPVVQQVLSDDRPGAVRPWRAANGDTGHVYLLSGGAKAGESCGKVKLTTVKAGVEGSGYRFRYCRDAAGRWRTAG